MNGTEYKVVSLGYRLRSDAGDLIESQDSMTPLIHLHREGMMPLPILKQSPEGKRPSDGFSLTISPHRAYGERDTELVEQVPGDIFGNQPAQPGMELQELSTGCERY